MRVNCLYCELEGSETKLLPSVRGGLCPIHSADFISKNTLPSIEQQIYFATGIDVHDPRGKANKAGGW